jgi:hypothetical protein
MGGALGIDSSTVPSPISTSSKSDDGKSRAGGEDMLRYGWEESKRKTRRVASIQNQINFRAGLTIHYPKLQAGRTQAPLDGAEYSITTCLVTDAVLAPLLHVYDTSCQNKFCES